MIFRAPAFSGLYPDSSSFVHIDSVGPVTAYVDTVLPASQEMFAYVVRAHNAAGASIRSNVAFVYAHLPVEPHPFRLSGYLDSTGTIQLRWIPPAEAVAVKYFIYRAPLLYASEPPDEQQFSLVDSTTEEFYSEAPADSSPGFVYQVRALLDSGDIARSSLAFVWVSVPPTHRFIRLEASLGDSGRPVLEWTPPDGVTISKYYVFRGPLWEVIAMSPFPRFQLIDSTTATEYIDWNTPPTQDGFTYRVTGVSSQGLIESNVAAVLIVDRIHLEAFVSTIGKVKLIWTEPANSQPPYYLIERFAFLDSTRVIDSTAWVAVDTVTDNEYLDTPAPSTAFGFAYRVSAPTATGLLRSNVAVVPWWIQPRVPFLLSGQPQRDGTVTLKWTEPKDTSVVRYHIFRATLMPFGTQLDSSMVFTEIDSTVTREYRDTPPTSESKAFAYYVQAVTLSGVERTNTIVILFGQIELDHDRVMIVSEPNRAAQAGRLYTYQPQAVSSDSTATFRWFLGTHPAGMAIDSLTGLVQWTPTERGWAEVRILAVSSLGGRASQEYQIAVGAGRGIVEGVITDTLGSPLPRVLVRLLKRDHEFHFTYSVVTDSVGFYRFDHVDVGTYLAHAIPLTGDFLPEWYAGARRLEDATAIIVADSAMVTVNFQLKARAAEIPFVSVAGTVSDDGGSPLPGATVVFARPSFFLNAAKSEGTDAEPAENARDAFAHAFAAGIAAAFRLDASSHQIYRALADSSGEYSLRIPAGPYVAVAFAQGYRKVFYDGETDLLSADVMKLASDTSGIDFALSLISAEWAGSISGTVIDTAKNIGVPARIVAFRTISFRPVDAYSTDTDEGGNYVLENLPPGSYYVLAVPLGNYSPSFYSVSGPTVRWRRATPIEIDGNAFVGVDIVVREIPRLAIGYTSINGSVTSPASAPTSLSGQAATAGVDGAVAFAVSPDGSVAGYGVTDAEGNYTIANLAPESYTVSADRIGFEEPIETVVNPTYDASGSPVSAAASFSLDPVLTAARGDGEPVPQEYSLLQNYPNPFNPSTHIAFSLPSSDHVTLTVYNILGQRIATLADGEYSAGLHVITWNGCTMSGTPVSSGIYLYQIRTDRFTATRKMLLLK